MSLCEDEGCPHSGIKHVCLDTLDEARQRFAESAADAAYADVIDYHMWLKFWSGPEWGDEPPHRLFGSWVKSDGDAT